MQQDDIRLIVQMTSDYTTESHNLGKRTYRENGCYQVCPFMLEELMGSGHARQLDPAKAPYLTRIEREAVAVLPTVSRWFTANGSDTHYLVEGRKQTVPSNLAAFLTLNGYAEAA